MNAGDRPDGDTAGALNPAHSKLPVILSACVLAAYTAAIIAASPVGSELTGEEERFVDLATVGFMFLYFVFMMFGLLAIGGWVLRRNGATLEDPR